VPSAQIIAFIFIGLLVFIGVAVWVARRAQARAERRARNLRALLEVSRQATANLDQQQVLEIVVQAVQDVMGYPMASILLLDESRNELVASAISTHKRDLIPLGDRVPLGRGMVGTAAQTGQTQLANDVLSNPNYIRAPGGWDPGSEISLPLKSGGRVLGVLDVEAEQKNAFRPDDVQVLETLADQLVVILEKARLFEGERRRAERLATINGIGRLMTASLSMEDMLTTAVEAIQMRMQFPSVSVFLIDPDALDTLVLKARSSGAANVGGALGYRQPIARGLLGRAARTRRPVLVNDVAADPDYVPIPNTQHRAELAIPIQVAERLLGVLNIEDERPFTAEDVTAFQIVADQLAVAIDNTRLFDDTRANVRDLMALYELSQRITGARSADDTMRAALEELAAEGIYRCTIALFSDYDKTGRPTRFHVPYLYVPGEGVFPVNEYVPTGDDELNPLLDRGEMVAIADVSQDERVPENLRAEQLAVGRPALAIIPLMEGGQRIGNLVLSHTAVHRWTEAELRRYRSSANQIAVAIENARRFEREVKRTNRLELIARLGQRIAARLNPAELLTITAESLHTRLGYEHISIFLVDAADETFLVQSAVASLWDWLGNPPYRQVVTHGILGVAAQTRAPVLINDVQADPRYVPIPGAEALRSELAIPILLGDRLLGVLDAASVNRFSEDDTTGLSIVADQLAIALENARLYNRVQEVAVLDERQRLARDLHDSVTQLIFSITLVAQSIKPAYQKDVLEGERRIARVLELSQQALAEMRELLAELRSPVQEGLVPAIQKHVERLKQRESLQVQCEVATYSPRPVEQEETLYRIVQEALNNVVKHARAQKALVQLTQSPRGLELTVSDDGQGFDVKNLPQNGRAAGGLGLRGMRERIERLGGTIYIQSNPGAGTAIVAFLPERSRSSPGGENLDPKRRTQE